MGVDDVPFGDLKLSLTVRPVNTAHALGEQLTENIAVGSADLYNARKRDIAFKDRQTERPGHCNKVYKSFVLRDCRATITTGARAATLASLRQQEKTLVYNAEQRKSNKAFQITV